MNPMLLVGCVPFENQLLQVLCGVPVAFCTEVHLSGLRVAKLQPEKKVKTILVWVFGKCFFFSLGELVPLVFVVNSFVYCIGE